MRFSTLDERKKFVLFNTCSLIFVPMLIVLILCVLSLVGAYKITEMFNTDFKFIVGAMVFIWCLIGSWRFYSYLWDNEPIARFFHKIVGLFLMAAFPLVYLYNLFIILKSTFAKE